MQETVKQDRNKYIGGCYRAFMEEVEQRLGELAELGEQLLVVSLSSLPHAVLAAG